MGYIFDFNTARAYEQWIQNPKIQRTAALENRLMLQMLNPSRGKTLLEVGCGSGIGLLPFIEKGVLVTGLDPSPYMLDIARSIVGQRVDLHRGVGEDLPFEDNSFHYVCLNSTLEFVNDPHSVLAEACRVAKHKVYVGILNRYALRGYRKRIKNVFEENMADPLHYFSVGDIKRTLHQLLGKCADVCAAYLPFSGIMGHYDAVDGTVTPGAVVPVGCLCGDCRLTGSQIQNHANFSGISFQDGCKHCSRLDTWLAFGCSRTVHDKEEHPWKLVCMNRIKIQEFDVVYAAIAVSFPIAAGEFAAFGRTREASCTRWCMAN